MATLSKPVSWDSRTPIGKVMVVDRQLQVRISVCRALAASGFEAIPAGDGPEAVERYQANRDAISLVVMDIGLPESEGVEAARQIRAINPAAKIIMTLAQDGAVPLDPRPDACLPKPLRLGAFFDVVQQVLRVERRRNANRMEPGPPPP
jgi:DNA-binding response OmpR family regulator